MNFVILGGSILSCRLAELLNDKFNVYLVDSRMELGMPTNDVGVLNDPSIVSHFMDASKLNYANFQRDGVRSEWVAKFYAHFLSSIGVKIFTRSKIEGSENQIEIISTGNPSNHSLTDFKIIDLRDISGEIRMGESENLENLKLHSPLDYSDYIVREGAIISSNEEFNNLDIDVLRSDGTREIWWKDSENIQPKNGFLERMTTFGPKKASDNSIDYAFKSASQIFEKITS